MNSKEIAEEMASRIHPIWAMEDEDRTFDQIIRHEIPLTQLIEVARAANTLIRRGNGEDFLALASALGKIQATGNAEWL